MNSPSTVPRPRSTSNVDVGRLATTAAVRAFMARLADDYRDPLTGEVLASCLAEGTANAFGLFHDDGFTLPRVLYDVALSVARRSGGERSR